MTSRGDILVAVRTACYRSGWTAAAYLLVDGEAKLVERFLLGPSGTYGRPDVFGSMEVLSLVSLGGLELPLLEIFETEDRSSPA